MRWTTTAVLAALLLGLGAFYYVYEIREGPARERAAAAKGRAFPDLEPRDVEEIQIARGPERIHLRRSGEAWALVAPVSGRAERQAAEDLAAALAALRVEREVDPNPARPADFGLEPPAAEITFRARGEEHRLRLGSLNPTGLSVYAQADGRAAVVLLPEALLAGAQRGVAEFRDRTLLAFEPGEVRSLEVQPRGGGTLIARRTAGGGWEMTAPLALPADGERIADLLERLRGARIAEFASEAPAPGDPYGVETGLRLTLWVGEGKDRVAKVLRFGKTRADRRVVYAQREGDPAVFAVDEAVLAAVPATVAVLRDKSVFAYEGGRVERVELESPKGRVVLVQEGGSWRITTPTALRADEEAVRALLDRARGLRAREFVAEDARALARFGLDRPEVRLTVWEREAREPRVLLLAPARERDLAYAARLGGGPVVQVERAALADLARSVEELRDHALFGELRPDEVARVEIRQDDLTLVVERSGERQWRLVAPQAGSARAAVVDEVIRVLRTLKWRRRVAEQGWDPVQYKLDRPSTTVTLTGQDGRPLAALAIGKRGGGEAYVRVPGQPALYVIESKDLGRIPASVDQLLG